MEREIEDLTTQQPEVSLVPEGIQLNYELRGCDLLVLLLPQVGMKGQIVPAAHGNPLPWSVISGWGLCMRQISGRWMRRGDAIVDALVLLVDHLARHRPLIEMLAAMLEPAGDGEDHQDQDNDEQDGSEVHAALVPASEEIEP